jgi:hypothetical protein
MAALQVQKQIAMEFDFRREAEVMDTIAFNLRSLRKRVVVPKSVPGLVRALHPTQKRKPNLLSVVFMLPHMQGRLLSHRVTSHWPIHAVHHRYQQTQLLKQSKRRVQ